MERSVGRFSDITGPHQGACHKKCYQEYTSKSQIERVRRAAAAAAAAEAVEASISAVEIPTQQRKIATYVDYCSGV